MHFCWWKQRVTGNKRKSWGECKDVEELRVQVAKQAQNCRTCSRCILRHGSALQKVLQHVGQRS